MSCFTGEKYVFGVLGILSMGGVYVPLDDRHPDERLEFMIKDTGSKVLIVSNETYVRAQGLIDDDVVLLNISDIMDGDIVCNKKWLDDFRHYLGIGCFGDDIKTHIIRKRNKNLVYFALPDYGMADYFCLS